ncbi:hypothetical protein QCA50_000746 [Cerrena zonata]|uniref:Nudix hydrolase domain-containing protein n=1 Tax=Cerrena zonata TaxID=2478898 RepID=A0AAW0GR79_9APHY
MASNERRSDLLKFHRPKLRLPSGNKVELTTTLSPESKQCIKNLAGYKPPRLPLRVPKSRTAAVLVALFVGRKGDLYVLLSRRATTLRTYAGDTSLPGGKWEQGDRGVEWTARREAYEEIGLPLDRQKVPLLCILEPFLAATQVIVTPVVVLVLDNTIRPLLNSQEVTSVFSHPLASFLSDESPFPQDTETLEVRYHTYNDMKWTGLDGDFRMHRFLTGREAGGTKPIFGLTASILIRVAMVGYARDPEFKVSAPDQLSQPERIAHMLKHHPTFREAAIKEGINPDKTPDMSQLQRRRRDDRRRRKDSQVKQTKLIDPRLRVRAKL